MKIMSDERSPIRVGILYSGGKDSNYALYRISQDPKFEIACLIVIIPKEPHSMLFHHVNIKWTELQARAMDINRFEFTQLEDEEASLLRAVKEAKRIYDFEALASGGILSKFQAKKFKAVADALNLSYFSPVWGIAQEEYLWELYRRNFKIIIDGVSALGLGKEWLGRELDEKAIRELILLSKRYGFNPSLEGGEGETFVLDMPLFKKRIEVVESEIVWKGDWGAYLIKEAKLVNKDA